MALETPVESAPLPADELHLIDAWWRAANYLSVGQIYLLANPLLREPLRREHIKPRLLGHFGTTPGLTLLYAHLNRAIRARDLNAIFITGPGHGGPGLVANAYLEGTYSEVYAHVGRNEDGLRELFRQFSFPGGIPSHVAPETPGSIHEGGELGYALSHAFGAAFDNPDLLVACVVGDGEAETGPKEVDGLPVEGTWRSHQVPLADVREHPERIVQLEEWLRSYRPEELFDERGAIVPELDSLAPRGERRMSANPHANGGLLLRELALLDFRDYALDVPKPGTTFG